MNIKKYDISEKSGSSVIAVQRVPKELLSRYAGKSTLLKILSRITALTEGIIELHWRVGIRGGLQQYVAWFSETHPSIR